jgi:hypothetical protein
MSFIGAAVVKQVSDGLVRITGLSLDNASNGQTFSGTIGLFENNMVAPPVDVRLPAAFKPRTYDYPDVAAPVSLQDSIQVWFVYTNPGPVVQPIGIVKTGTTPEDFLIEIVDAAPLQAIPEPPLPPPVPVSTGDLEIYVRYH